MASSSSSSSGRRCRYDVFLNFRGEDTRRSFVCHLHSALTQKLLNPFIDAEDLRIGNDLSDLLNAITDSKFSIVVFSQDYASSTWCLKELVQIMKCKVEQEQIVVPVFYQVDPSDIRKQKGTFGEAFVKHERNQDLQEVQSWRLALAEATNLSGLDSRNYNDDAKLIDDIVDHVFKEWFRISSCKNNHLVGMDSRLDKMRQLLRIGMDPRVLRVGIWGMGGIGKTTIATEVYDEIRYQFDHCSFLRDVKEGFSSDPLGMQKQLLYGILKKDDRIDTWNDGCKIMKRLSKKKVLFVLDDVDSRDQIETLLGDEPSFGGGSRIIVTTRDIGILNEFDERYEAELLSDDDAGKLFRQYAFKNKKPSGDYYYPSRRALHYAQGLPLALRVLGSHLVGGTVSNWEEELNKIKEFPNLGIQGVLRTSFDGLDPSQRKIFLDIVCFFKGMHVTNVLHSCDGFYPRIGLKVLVDRALVTITESGELEMHDLLQELGREIVRTESKEPGKRSRLWSYGDVERALNENTATEAVEGLMINDLPNSEIYFEAEAFVRMTNLRLLIFTGWNIYHHHVKIHVNGDLKRLSSELRVLVWHRCPLKSLPSNFHPKNLVYLDMRLSHLKRLWQGRKPLKKMISINLNYCEDLNETPDLTEATNLEKLDLEGCISLREVHSSIAGLTNLVFLSLRGCRELKSLPSSIHLKSLKTLCLSDCSNLKVFPEILEDMEALLELKLDGTAIKELPSSIERLWRLQSLSMKNCKSLVCLPDSICNLAELRFLNLSGCLKLCNLPENLENLESLWELLVHGSGIKQHPVSILRLKLGRLSFYYCKQMEVPPSAWSSSIQGRFNVVRHINLSDCNLLELPDAIAHFPSLEVLNLSRTNLEILPAIIRLDCLKYLELVGCKRLKSTPELPFSINYLSLLGCTALEILSTSKPSYDMGRCFTFSNCSQPVQTDLFRDIVETHPPPQGWEIPEWFIHQCRGSSITVQLLPNWFDDKFLGFAICAVADELFFGSPYSKLSVRCFCTFKGDHCEYRFSVYLFHGDFHHEVFRWLEPNHLFLGYVPWSEFGINGEEVNERCYTEAKFEIQLEYFDCYYLPARFNPCIEKCGVQFFFANNEEVGHEDSGEPMVHSERSLEGCSAEPRGDITSDTCHEEQYLKLLSKLFDGPNRNSEEDASDVESKIEDHDEDEQYLKLSELVDGANRNSRDIYADISDESDCEIEDNDSSGKRKIVSWWRQKVRVTSGLMQGDLDDGFSWNCYMRPEQGTGYLRSNYYCTYGCRAMGKLRISENDPTIRKIEYIGRHTCWKTLPMLTHQVRVTPDMGLEAEGPSDCFSWGEYGQMNLPGDKHPRVCYVCTPRNVRGCMAIKEVQRSNDDPTILKITYRGRHTCIQAYTISIGGRGDGRISEGGGALRIGDQVVQSPSSLGDNGSGGNVIRLADRAMDDNNVNNLLQTRGIWNTFRMSII